tara:strand:+ start:889 stop:1068 length:180 start_codon:yes stop_codon:yes gene_type:complete
MNDTIITNAKYHTSYGSNVSVSAIINGKLMSVPMDSDNTEYAEILRQVEAGDLTIEAAS